MHWGWLGRRIGAIALALARLLWSGPARADTKLDADFTLGGGKRLGTDRGLFAFGFFSLRAFVEYRELFGNDRAPRARELLGGLQLDPAVPLVGIVALVWIASSSEAPAMWGH